MLEQCEDEGEISGVVDDRGTFIYITMGELESISKFISKKGRVTLDMVAKECNRVISLEEK